MANRSASLYCNLRTELRHGEWNRAPHSLDFLNFRAGSSRETRGGKAAPVALSMPAMADLFATEEQAPRAA
ncbi:hypothetical protein, partial [Escherichia coli]|uniref:hypothetical protein n=1 Tax=Escherichia coli TaxID=562 RepID=UPI001BFE7111